MEVPYSFLVVVATTIFFYIGALHLKLASIIIVDIKTDTKKDINQILMDPAFCLCLRMKYKTNKSKTHIP